MIKIITLFILILLLTSIAHAQEDPLEDKDYISFVSVFAGINGTKYTSDDILENSEYGSGFNLGVTYTLFPDYEWQSYFIRVGLEYSREQTEDNVPREYQNESVTVKGEFDNINLSLFFAYRFDREAKVDSYIGAGGRLQYLLNSNDSYNFIREDGSSFPVFQPNNPTAPFRYNLNAQSINLGLILEAGAYFKIMGKFANASFGYLPSKFMGDNTGSFNLTKSTFYAKLGYQIF